MDGKRLFRSIQLQNILSYGSNTPELELEPLNVFIGPNGSGKSNFIEALKLLAWAPRDIQRPIIQGGGISEWIWKGEVTDEWASRIRASISGPSGNTPLSYLLDFTSSNGKFLLEEEALVQGEIIKNESRRWLDSSLYSNVRGHARIRPYRYDSDDSEEPRRKSVSVDISPSKSILEQRKEPDIYPELAFLSQQFEQFHFYSEWDMDALRRPQKTDLPSVWLVEDGGNLGLVLNDIDNKPAIKQHVLRNLRNFFPSVVDYKTVIQGGTVQIFLHEEGLKHPVPASRLSDGTLRFLCLVVLLAHPEPPPVVCIEEPELGLHPDAIPIVAEMLIDASSRTQLFVTTHSDMLVDALNDYPESIVVCEKSDKGTTLQRLDPENLNEWLSKYRLGELWQMGEIGGNP